MNASQKIMLANWELAGAKLQVHKNYVMDQVTVNLSWHYWNQSDANSSFATVNSMHYEIISCVVFSLGYKIEKKVCIDSTLLYLSWLLHFLSKKTLLTSHTHYEKKLTKNIRPTDILKIYTNI